MVNKLGIFLVVLILSGCATTEPVIKTVIQRVEIPIPVPCATEEPAPPQFNFDKLSEDDDIFTKTKSILADRKLYQAYQEELRTALKSCK